MEVPEGLYSIYGSDVAFLLVKAIYGLKNTEKVFWRELMRAFSAMGWMRSNADP